MDILFMSFLFGLYLQMNKKGMGKMAIILGATGLTGGLLLRELLEDNRYDKVKIFSRKTIDLDHPKIKEYLGDILDLNTFKNSFKADEVFCCIGTTAKKTPDENLYKKIDIGIPTVAAKLCKINRIDTFVVMSSLGADVKSKVFYNRTKGEMEEEVLKENILNTYILRPSIILGDRKESRLGEAIGKIMMQTFQFLLFGKFKKYRAIESKNIAKAMVYLANTKLADQIIESDQIVELSRK